MEFQLKTRLDGTIALTSRFHEDAGLQRNKSFYKFIWVRHGSLDIEIDHVVMHLKENEIISLSPLHHVDMLRAEAITCRCSSTVTSTVSTDTTTRCRATAFCSTVRRTS